ncbi:hypothetical protein CHL76_02455 [Marinococcus halophilus]|uniref:Uncharacterized protein n=1 Tax=Marinococcus halophilus TaxID=1371 RepID=A0A510Y1M4_MARHA|nr:hypothetical protein [Marinococcus halophilus]OZT81237.1 hypothetical protein CHL76_02455 [Marinococcus halophilus]GEK57179.1 hypothetical protein MHA01_00840 [Marinococcus halophilus]
MNEELNKHLAGKRIKKVEFGTDEIIAEVYVDEESENTYLLHVSQILHEDEYYPDFDVSLKKKIVQVHYKKLI